ncbi:MAG: hypothetical protein WBG92_04750 [Thiohalocapsa sp.]
MVRLRSAEPGAALGIVIRTTDSLGTAAAVGGIPVFAGDPVIVYGVE